MDKDLEKIAKEMKSIDWSNIQIKPRPTHERILEQLKDAYVEQNPYTKPKGTVFGDSWSEWNFEHHERISRLKSALRSMGREDVLEQYEQFVHEQEEKAIIEENKKYIKKIAEYFDPTSIEPGLLDYLVNIEKRLAEANK